MKRQIKFKTTSKIIFGTAVITMFLITGCAKQNETAKVQQQNVSESKSSVDSTIIRSKDVNVSSIDANKDGKVYQCQMDYDVISDKPGTCPKCGMKLEEVTVKQAQENLKKSAM